MTALLLSTATFGVGRADVAVRATITSGLVWPTCFAAGAQWGPVGLAAAWVVAVPVAVGLNISSLCKAVQLAPAEAGRAVAKAIGCGVIMVIGISLARAALQPLSTPVTLVLLIGAGGITYLGSLYVVDRTLWPSLRGVLKPTSTNDRQEPS
jgi:hypothetical protein